MKMRSHQVSWIDKWKVYFSFIKFSSHSLDSQSHWLSTFVLNVKVTRYTWVQVNLCAVRILDILSSFSLCLALFLCPSYFTNIIFFVFIIFFLCWFVASLYIMCAWWSEFVRSKKKRETHLMVKKSQHLAKNVHTLAERRKSISPPGLQAVPSITYSLILTEKQRSQRKRRAAQGKKKKFNFLLLATLSYPPGILAE